MKESPRHQSVHALKGAVEMPAISNPKIAENSILQRVFETWVVALVSSCWIVTSNSLYRLFGLIWSHRDNLVASIPPG